MDLPRPANALPPPEEIEARMNALLALRRQMLELHARLEFLRLMVRVGGPRLPR